MNDGELHFSVSSHSGQASWSIVRKCLRIGWAKSACLSIYASIRGSFFMRVSPVPSSRHRRSGARLQALLDRAGAGAPEPEPLDRENRERGPDRGEADGVGAGEGLAEREHREQELERGRDILKEAERRIRQALGRGVEQQ